MSVSEAVGLHRRNPCFEHGHLHVRYSGEEHKKGTFHLAEV
jgi:hypothetical protein